MINFRSIKTQISIFYLSISFIVIIIFSGILYYSVSTIFIEEGISRTAMAIENSKDIIGIYIDKIKGISKIIAENESVINYLQSKSTGEIDNIEKLIDTILKTDNHIKSVVIVGRDGSVLSNEEDFNFSISDDMMNEKWYIEALNNNMPVFSEARKNFYRDEEGWVISLSQEITDSFGGNLGVLRIDIKYCFIGDYIEDLNLGSNGYIFMINENEELIYHRDTTYFVDKDKNKELIHTFNKGYSYDRELRQLIYRTNIDNSNWSLVGVSSLDGIKMLEKQLFYIVAFIGIVIFVVMNISGTFLANRISKPLRNVIESMNQIDNLGEVKVYQKGFYEIILLEENYNKMIRRIKELMKQLSEKERRLRKLEVNTLISQINPHFLYNILDTIVWMAEVGDSKKVIDMTKALAGFLTIIKQWKRICYNRG